MPGMPRGLSSENRKSLYPESFVRKSKRRTSWASKEPHRKKQNYRRSVPCSFVFQTDSSPSSRGVQAGNADSAQRSQQHGGGLYISVTSQRPGGAIGQPRTVLQGIMGWQRGHFMQLVTPVSRFTQQRDRLNENLGIKLLNRSATHFTSYFYNGFKFKFKFKKIIFLISWLTSFTNCQKKQHISIKFLTMMPRKPKDSLCTLIFGRFNTTKGGCVSTRVHLLVGCFVCRIIQKLPLWPRRNHRLNFWNVSMCEF